MSDPRQPETPIDPDTGLPPRAVVHEPGGQEPDPDLRVETPTDDEEGDERDPV